MLIITIKQECTGRHYLGINANGLTVPVLTEFVELSYLIIFQSIMLQDKSWNNFPL